MGRFLESLERRLRGRAVPHLTAVMIGCFVLGYIMQAVNPDAARYMNLNIYQILRGQVWRLVTWVIIPPQELNIFTIIMLLFYFSIGTSLERIWGDARYNIYIFGGLLISIAAAFITYFAFRIRYAGPEVGSAIGVFFTTYNICMSILLAYAATFPDATVLLMFVIPIRMKYLGWIYAAIIVYEAIPYIRVGMSSGNSLFYIYVIALAAALANFLIFFFGMRSRTRLTAEQKRRQREFRRSVEQAKKTPRGMSGRRPAQERSGAAEIIDIPAARHRCEICGRTEISNPDLEFRYCSKCSGDHEYCMDHLYTHQHITQGDAQ